MNSKTTLAALVLIVVAGVGWFAWQKPMQTAASSAAASPRADKSLRPQDAVVAQYKLLEKALREGNVDLWLSLQSRETLERMTADNKANLRANAHADPTLRFVPLASAANDRHGVVIGRIDGSSSYSARNEIVRFALEDGSWKIVLEDFHNTPIDLRALPAILPPADSSFLRAGSPWSGVAYAERNTKFFQPSKLEWKMQATQDETLLYVRFEAQTPLPLTGTELFENSSLPGKPVKIPGPSAPPIMEIRISPSGEDRASSPTALEFQTGAQTQSRSLFGKDGKATSIRYFLIYSLSLRDGDHQIFASSTDDTFSTLVSAQDRFLDLRIPLESLVLDGKSALSIDLQEANSFAKILPYHVKPFSR